ncbi:MAG TPA: flagella basal body P-ring formation protein FlgA [Alloacidobacterium sp.]|nr:flagella basal body P-ring formation protein FlgA [Alloacidobacterium sp.]
MRRRFTAILSSIVLLCAPPALPAVCSSPAAAGQSSWTDHYLTDLASHHRWAVVVDCSHPERPWTLKEVPWQNTPRPDAVRRAKPVVSARATLLIPPGAKVRLWRNLGGNSIALAGTALEGGVAGEKIHVRTGSRGVVLEGIVRDAGSVELFTSGKWKSRLSDGWAQ